MTHLNLHVNEDLSYLNRNNDIFDIEYRVLHCSFTRVTLGIVGIESSHIRKLSIILDIAWLLIVNISTWMTLTLFSTL
jgi:hypothetical protein